jgi:hypothetical protein
LYEENKMPNTAVLAADTGLPISLTAADTPRAFPCFDARPQGVDFKRSKIASSDNDPADQLAAEQGMNAVLVALTALLAEGGANG